MEDIKTIIYQKEEYLKELANRFPTIDDAVTEIINLNSILALPRSIVRDLHSCLQT